MKKKLKKIIVFALTFFLTVSLVGVGQTNAYYSDTESSLDNLFSAGSLEISIDPIEVFPTADSSLGSLDLAKAVDDVEPVLPHPIHIASFSYVRNVGSLPSQYIASAELTGADISACDYVTVTATNHTTNFTSTGLIKDFISPATPTVNTSWEFYFNYDPNPPVEVWGKTCHFNWIFTAWQTNMPDASSGFTSVKKRADWVEVRASAGPIVLNEISVNPDSSASVPANREFIELYNNGDTPIDLANWQISEMGPSGEQIYPIQEYGVKNIDGTIQPTAMPWSPDIVRSTIIPEHGFIVLMLTDKSALDDSGDTVRLYDAGGTNKIDEYTYATEPQGYSYSRIPDGLGDWVDLTTPTPGMPNELAGGVIIEEKIIEPVIESAKEPIIEPVIEPTIGPALEPVKEEPPIEEPAPEISPEIPPEAEPQPEADQPSAEAPESAPESVAEPVIIVEPAPVAEEVPKIEDVPVISEEPEPPLAPESAPAEEGAGEVAIS